MLENFTIYEICNLYRLLVIYNSNEELQKLYNFLSHYNSNNMYDLILKDIENKVLDKLNFD